MSVHLCSSVVKCTRTSYFTASQHLPRLVLNKTRLTTTRYYGVKPSVFRFIKLSEKMQEVTCREHYSSVPKRVAAFVATMPYRHLMSDIDVRHTRPMHCRSMPCCVTLCRTSWQRIYSTHPKSPLTAASSQATTLQITQHAAHVRLFSQTASHSTPHIPTRLYVAHHITIPLLRRRSTAGSGRRPRAELAPPASTASRNRQHPRPLRRKTPLRQPLRRTPLRTHETSQAEQAREYLLARFAAHISPEGLPYPTTPPPVKSRL